MTSISCKVNKLASTPSVTDSDQVISSDPKSPCLAAYPPGENNPSYINPASLDQPPVKGKKPSSKDHSFPTIALYNMRSLLPKISNAILDFKMRLCDLFCLTEVWSLDSHDDSETNELNKMKELDGIDIIYSTRWEKEVAELPLCVTWKHIL